MIAIEFDEPRLLKLRVESPTTTDEVDSFIVGIRARVAAAPDRVIVCTDLRSANIFSPEASERLISMMRSDNPKVLRNGFLLAASAVFSMQVGRMVTSAAGQQRRSFIEPAELTEWLHEVSSKAELQALREFVGLEQRASVSASGVTRRSRSSPPRFGRRGKSDPPLATPSVSGVRRPERGRRGSDL